MSKKKNGAFYCMILTICWY